MSDLLNRVWVVEMWDDVMERWVPTVGARLSRAEGRKERQAWQQRNPHDDFRLRLYRVQP